MGTYYEDNETLIKRLTWEWIGEKAYEIADLECYGPVEFSQYFAVYRARTLLSAIQTGKLDTQGKEPLLNEMTKIVNKYPARSQNLSQPPTP